MLLRLLFTFSIILQSAYALDFQVLNVDVYQSERDPTGTMPLGPKNVDANSNGISEAIFGKYNTVAIQFYAAGAQEYYVERVDPELGYYVGQTFVIGEFWVNNYSYSSLSTPFMNLVNVYEYQFDFFGSSLSTVEVKGVIDISKNISENNLFQETEETNNSYSRLVEIVHPQRNFRITSSKITQGDIENPDTNDNGVIELVENEEVIFNVGVSLEDLKNNPLIESQVSILIDGKTVGLPLTRTLSTYIVEGNELEFNVKIPRGFVSGFKESDWGIQINIAGVDQIVLASNKLLVMEEPFLAFREMSASVLRVFKMDFFFWESEFAVYSPLDIPGMDHVGIGFYDENKVYESHPGYPTGSYEDRFLNKPVVITEERGVQSQHTVSSFFLNSKLPDDPNVYPVDTYKVKISRSLANKMRDFIKQESEKGYTQNNDMGFLENHKGKKGEYTCSGLIERAAEFAGHNNGEGFVPSILETIGPSKINFLFPQSLLSIAQVADMFNKSKNVIKGVLDPVDFMITDPIGRRLGYNRIYGRINEIPDAYFSGDGVLEAFYILNALPGYYSIELFGLGENTKILIESNVEGKTNYYRKDEFLAMGEYRGMTEDDWLNTAVDYVAPTPEPQTLIEIVNLIPESVVKKPVENRMNNLRILAQQADKDIMEENYKHARVKIEVLQNHILKWIVDTQEKENVLKKINIVLEKLE